MYDLYIQMFRSKDRLLKEKRQYKKTNVNKESKQNLKSLKEEKIYNGLWR